MRLCRSAEREEFGPCRCTVSGCQQEGCVISHKATLRIQNSTIRECKGPGMDTVQDGTAIMQGCAIEGNAGGPIGLYS